MQVVPDALGMPGPQAHFPIAGRAIRGAAGLRPAWPDDHGRSAAQAAVGVGEAEGITHRQLAVAHRMYASGQPRHCQERQLRVVAFADQRRCHLLGTELQLELAATRC